MLRLEAVACKDWLTNKVDRCVGGRVAKQQCVGPLQLPLNNVGVMALDFTGKEGIATSIGHAPIAALIDPKAGSRNAIAEALSNIVFAPLAANLKSVSLSANWMWACKNEGEDARLYEAVQACSGLGMTLWLVSMSLFIVSSLLGSLNYIVTVINLRVKGMSMTRLPLTIWAFLVTAILGVLSFPVLFAAALLLIFDRSFGTSFYLSDIYISGHALEHTGGSPILFQHLFWFLGHPEVYIVLLPALGLTSEVISTNARKPIFGYKAMIGSILVIAFLSFIVWGHHMFITGMNPFLGSVFTFTTLLVAIPSAVKVFNYLTTLWKGNIHFTPAMLFATGLVSTFITGGLTGIILGDSALDINVHDTYFVVAHFHIVMGASAIFGMFAGVYHWFPRMYGRMMNKQLGYLHFWATIVCVYGVFFPMHFLGLAGVPRRYYSNTEFPLFDSLQDINVLVSTFAILGALAQCVFLFNFFYSMFKGSKATSNPWNSNTLEWTAPIEHIHGNWPGAIPEVHRWPYDYSKPGMDDDFVPQSIPMKPGEEEIH